jgi:NitT/TauT family transport system substrate-binding protein
MSICRMITAALGTALLIGVATNAGAQDKLSVRVDFTPWGVHAALHLAQEKGWYKEEGLLVDVQDGRGSGNTLQLVNAGQIDVGQVQVGLITQARANGATVKSFADFGRRTDLAVLVDRDSPITKVADFKGKSVAVFAASTWGPFLDLWMKSGGLTRETVNLMFVDPSALWGTYTTKRADGLMSTVASALPIAEASRPSKLILASDAGIAFPSYGFIATEKTLSEKKSALKRLVKTQIRAWGYLRDGHIDEGVEAMMKQRADAKLDPAVLREQIRLTIEYFDTPATKGKPIGWQAEQDWVDALTSLEAAGAIKPGWKASDYYTNDFIN